ncbi:hypothetical protein N752_06425 [Desulforamulus aquiferis]|nr:hypothetical protein N752_06425 [Desulforamulus aquiferis]
MVEGDMVVGIVSRTDVLQTLHEGFQGRYSTTYTDKNGNSPKSSNIRPDMQRVLPGRIMGILAKAGEVAENLNYQVYAVGGLVRDVLLKVENLDVDLVVEGDGILMPINWPRLSAVVFDPMKSLARRRFFFPMATG